MAEPLSCDIDTLDLTESIDGGLLSELAELCCFGLRQEAATGEWSISIVLTSDEHLTQLHAEFMGIAEPTDIMTFPHGDEPGGEIVISVAQASRQKGDEGWDLEDELRFLVLHGVLHLTGWDDATVEMRAAMLDRQRGLLDAFQNDPSSNR
ncbi:MAG: rRNA maturation RNase YbeY [Thermomicrobiales bacterium]|nr:rRNA maturation RNase YbeY [Thermomicrobiales bacterium]MCO5222779.1 rRNA maturation RNase YbeY [Thermomicrobiales bacterium]